MSSDSWNPIGICGWRVVDGRPLTAPPSYPCKRPISSIIRFVFFIEALLVFNLGVLIGSFASTGALLYSFPPLFSKPVAPPSSTLQFRHKPKEEGTGRMQYSTYFPTTFVVVEFVIVIICCPKVYSGHRFSPPAAPL